MITLKTKEDIEILRESGRRLSEILYLVAKKVAPGVKTAELNDLAEELIATGGDKPAFKNYRPDGSPLAYPTALCVSINEEIVHGIPSQRILKEGDIVSLDLGLNHQGRFTDMAITVPVGKVEQKLLKLISATREALDAGIKEAVVGQTTNDIAKAIEKTIITNGFQVVEELCGHGVGFAPHEDPYVPNYSVSGAEDELKVGMVIAIEPMLTTGNGKIHLEKDGFTFRSADRAVCAHFEQTIAITDHGPEILTPLS